MNKKQIITVFSTLFLTFSFTPSFGQDSDTLQPYLRFVKKYFSQPSYWYVTDPFFSNNVKSLINFYEDAPIDTIINNFNGYDYSDEGRFITRLPRFFADSLSIPGYVPFAATRSALEKIESDVENSFSKTDAPVPVQLLDEIKAQARLLPGTPQANGFQDTVGGADEQEDITGVPADSVQATIIKAMNFDNLREAYIRSPRVAFDDSYAEGYRDFVINTYHENMKEHEISLKRKEYLREVKRRNDRLVSQHNNIEVRAINDSLFNVVQRLASYANMIDSNEVLVENLTGQTTSLILKNNADNYTRLWLKNEMNDSINVFLYNINKNKMRLVIDDAVMFSRIGRQQKKNYDMLPGLMMPNSLKDWEERFKTSTPWVLGGDGTLGFTQTYQENWKKGGSSSIALLTIMEGFANYTRPDGKVKWENELELRNGWVKPAEEKEVQKNDDRIEITSRYGVKAVNKWFYSAELNYETQLFKGYKYPREDKPPISAFMAPARTFLKLGMDYKPNKKLSILISPITSKTIYVRDTSLIDQTKFGIPEDRKRQWTPGLNADIMYKKNFTDDIQYETRYKMFINYAQPFQKFDINWENQFTMRLTDLINLNLMIHLIYDDDVLFTVYDDDGDALLDANGNEIAEPRLQIKELITVGFSYKINRKVFRTQKIR